MVKMDKITANITVVIKEKHASSTSNRIYIKPPGKSFKVIQNKQETWFNKLERIFLPYGYPDSVSKDYIAYQIWDTAQAFCSTITGTLATQEVLRGVGVGDTSATPLAATIIWVIKDGCGHIGRILFAFSHGTKLDAYSKKWRLFADTLNDAAMCIERALPLLKNYTTFVLCVSTVMKAIVGVAGGATRAALTQHHAQSGNMADVTAKDSAQETAVNLIASFVALFIITVFGNSIILFMILLLWHIVFNYLAVRAVCLRTLNEPRYLLIIDDYLKQEIIKTPCEINRREPILSHFMDQKICGFKLKLGCSVKESDIFNASFECLVKIKQIYEQSNHMLYPYVNKRIMYIFFKEDTNVDDVLCAYFHAVLLSIITCNINDTFLEYATESEPRPFAQVCRTLQGEDWCRQPVHEPALNGFTYEPSAQLHKYVHDIALKEWPRIRTALSHTGWDLSKHLLIVEGWRIVKPNIKNSKSTELVDNATSHLPQSTCGNSFLDIPKHFKEETDDVKKYL